MTVVFLFEGGGYYAKDRKIHLYRRAPGEGFRLYGGAEQFAGDLTQPAGSQERTTLTQRWLSLRLDL